MATPVVIAVITAILRSTSVATCRILCPSGRILLAATPAPMISTAVTMPGGWLRGVQHDGLHMAGCFLADSVKHATHLFLDSVSGWCWCGWPGRGMAVLL